ncbi:MAG: ABC transporter ATP-binding protein [Brevinematia bacterium]
MAEIVLKNISKTLLPEKRGYENVFLFLTRDITKGGLSTSGKITNDVLDVSNREGFKLKNINLHIPHGKTTVIIGSSGSGKSTLLKIIAGLINPDYGVVEYDGKNVEKIKPKDRKIGIVFENYALYPGYETEKNILSKFIFGKKVDSLVMEERLSETCSLLEIEKKHLFGRFPSTLSGGERQRVAIGRCITRDPELFLMDEPLSNLDAHLREKYRIQLKKLLVRFKITTVYVTHNQEEAILMGDKIVVMDNGEIIQEGSFEELYNSPKNLFVAEFINPFVELPSLVVFDGVGISSEMEGRFIGVRPDDFILKKTKENSLLRGECFFTSLSVRNKRQIVGIRYKEKEFLIYSKEKDTFKKGDIVWFGFKKYFSF